jgi:hypothetical protein
MKALSRCREPSWVIKRVISLIVLALVYVFFSLLATAVCWFIEYTEHMPWTQILSGGMIAVIVMLNWYMVDGAVWD